MLIHFGVIPYIVFDGDYLPSKAATEVERAKKREESKRKGLELYRLNKPSQAHLELQKAVDVTPEMARRFIDELKKIGVQYIVSPYEADAQLAYLERKGVIQGMISEDSDLLVFGAKRLLTKLDQYGDCVEINRADFTACREISLVGWSDAEFRRMAILSGCDYLASINRMGLKSAYRYVRKYQTIEKILQMLAFDGQYHIPTGYLEKFYKAELTFLHQRVFCPLKDDVVMMTDLPNEAQPEDFSFIGDEVKKDIAIGIAKGDLDPMTKQPIYVKNAIKSSPKTPWNNPRRNTFDMCSDVKANKSIDAFFTAKRTPLAELDPNSFTPSPTQQRLLQQASRISWESSPTPTDPPSLRSSTSLPLPAVRPAVAKKVSQSSSNPSLTSSGQNSTKRRRLCVESDDLQALGNAVSPHDRQSRFFTPDVTNLGPSKKPTKKTGKGKDADITIWSDDSIEDAMAELSDTPQKPIPVETRELKVFKDQDLETTTAAAWTGLRENDVPEGDSQSSTASRGTEVSENPSSTRATNVTSLAPSVARTLDEHVTAELKALAATYIYQPETQARLSQHQEIENNKDRPRANATTHFSLKPHLHPQRSMTPLQRLGAGALHRSKSCSSVAVKGVNNSKTTEEKVLSGVDIVTTKHGSALPARRTLGTNATVMRGSEDAIIPDSDGSADDTLSSTEEQGGEALIDLGRFAYAG